MNFLNNKEIWNSIEKAGKSIIGEEKNILAFLTLLDNRNFQEAHKMLLPDIQKRWSIEELSNFSLEDSYNENPPKGNFQEEQMPYKKIAIKFATLLVNKEYIKVRDMLSDTLKSEYSEELLKENMISMTEYFDNPEEIWVNKIFVEEEGSTDEGFVYVPIEGEGCSEAVFLEINLENGAELIDMIEWGRP